MKPLLHLMLLLQGIQLMAQSFTIQDIDVSVNAGTVLAVDTDLTNQGAIANEGTMYLYGEWMNKGSYVSEQGSLVFAGVADQPIINETGQLANVILEGGGNKIVSDSLLITGRLEMTDGNIVVRKNAILLLDSAVEIVGAGKFSHVEGMLYRKGQGDLFYPLGAGDEYLPVTLYDVAGLSPKVGLQAYQAMATNDLGNDLLDVSTRVYWRMDKDASYTNGYIALPYENEPFIQDVNHIVVAQANGLEDGFHTIGQSSIEGDNFAGLVRSEGLATGQIYAVAYVENPEKLPSIRVKNILTPFQDGKHDFLRIENLELYEESLVEIFDRNGALVFRLSDYDNRDRVFRGDTNKGPKHELPDGNYFYTIRSKDKMLKSGFLYLKR